MALDIRVESTPNPNSKKFVVGQTVAASTQWFADAGAAAKNPLAAALFGIDGVANVMMLNDFVTIGKQPNAEWAALESLVEAAINAHLG